MNELKKYWDQDHVQMRTLLLRQLGVHQEQEIEGFQDKIEPFGLRSFEESYLYYMGIPAYYEMVCIKDIVGTTHLKYAGYSLIENFFRLSRGEWNTKQALLNPNYYQTELKMTMDMMQKHNTPLELIESEGRYYIEGGNNRIIILKVIYAVLKERYLGNEQALKMLDKKFTFACSVRHLHRDFAFLYQLGIDLNWLAQQELRFSYRMLNDDIHAPIFEVIGQDVILYDAASVREFSDSMVLRKQKKER